MNGLSDAELVARSAAADERAFETLISRHFNAVYFTAYARLGNREAAEDLAQEVFLRAYLHIGTLKQPGQFAGWVCRVSRNLAEDWRRRQQTASVLVPLVPLKEDLVEGLQDNKRNVREQLDRQHKLDAINKAINALPADQREIVLLHFIEGLNDREIAERMGVHRTTIRYHLERTLAGFRDRLQPLIAEARPGLRPKGLALARTTAIIAGVGAMSAASKASLAASASIPAAAATTTSAAATASTGKAVGFLQSMWSMATAGAITMGTGKIITAAAGLVALGLIGTGVYRTTAAGSLFGGSNLTFVITPAAPGTVHKEDMDEKNGILREQALTSQQLIRMASDPRGDSYLVEADLPQGLYNIEIKGISSRGPDQDDVLALRKHVSDYFKVSFVEEKRTSTVLVMKAPNGPGKGLKPPESGGGMIMQPGRVKMRSASMVDIANSLGMASGMRVVNETGLDGTYAIDVKWHKTKPESLLTSVRSQLGLELQSEQRPVDVLVVKKGA